MGFPIGSAKSEKVIKDKKQTVFSVRKKNPETGKGF